MSKKYVLVAQIFMTFIMAATMSGLMGIIIMGPTLEWLTAWPKQFIIAWPIAFILTMFAWPASMKLAGTVLKPKQA